MWRWTENTQDAAWASPERGLTLAPRKGMPTPEEQTTGSHSPENTETHGSYRTGWGQRRREPRASNPGNAKDAAHRRAQRKPPSPSAKHTGVTKPPQSRTNTSACYKVVTINRVAPYQDRSLQDPNSAEQGGPSAGPAQETPGGEAPCHGPTDVHTLCSRCSARPWPRAALDAQKTREEEGTRATPYQQQP